MAVEKHHPRVLLIDDQSLVAEMVRHIVGEEPDIDFCYMPDAQQALTTALEFNPTVVLVDLMMPLVDGFGIIRAFRAHAETARVPMILLSSEDNAEVKVRGFAEGANDYLVKWPDKLELLARIRYHSNAYIAHKQRDDAFRSLYEGQQELLHRTKQLEESQAALHHAQKMEAVGKLTGGVAHDFNNVLQIIGGNLQLLRLATTDNEAAQRRIGAAIDGVSRGAKLASQLLAFARRQPLRPVAINAGALVLSMDELLRKAVGQATEIETMVADGLWNTLVDASQLENVLLNLALNARDAMSGKGKLTIEVRNAAPDEHCTAATGGADAGQYVLIAVSDTGDGMPPEVLSRAFEPFFTTKPQGEGTGLGLSMTYGFIKQSGGHIEIDSQPGRGTTVRLFLPRTRETAGAVLQDALRGPIAGGSESILIVEDEPQVLSATAELLENLGYRVMQAPDAAGALGIIESGEPIDLIFTDVVMPGPLSSGELARIAQTLIPGVRVLFASGYTESGIVQDGRLDPTVNLLKKPYSADDLARRIRHLLANRMRSETGA